MIRSTLVALLSGALLAGVPLLGGCDETVSHEKEVKVTDDKKVVDEKTVKRDVKDGVETITKETERTVEDR